jgi:hypothetical protein
MKLNLLVKAGRQRRYRESLAGQPTSLRPPTFDLRP